MTSDESHDAIRIPAFNFYYRYVVNPFPGPSTSTWRRLDNIKSVHSRRAITLNIGGSNQL